TGGQLSLAERDPPGPDNAPSPVTAVEPVDAYGRSRAGCVDERVFDWIDNDPDVRWPRPDGREEDEVAGRELIGRNAPPGAVLLFGSSWHLDVEAAEDVAHQSAAIETRPRIGAPESVRDTFEGHRRVDQALDAR